MPGTVILRPLEANLNKNATIGKMSPYYILTSGDMKHKSQVCKKAGKSPAWQEPVSLQRIDDNFCEFEVRTKRALLPDKKIGSCRIGLEDLTEEKNQKWYDIMNKGKVVGKVLIEASLAPNASGQQEIVIASDGGMALPAVATQSVNMLGETRTNELMPVDGAVYASSLGNIPSNYPYTEAIEQPIVQNVQPLVSIVQNSNLPNHTGQIVIHENQLIEDNRIQDSELPVAHGVKVRHTEYIVDPQDVPQRDGAVGDFNLEDIPLERTEEEEIKGRVVFVK